MLPAASAGRDLVRDEVQREVERRDRRDDAQRRAQVEADAALAEGEASIGTVSPWMPLGLFGGERERLDAAGDLAGRVLPRLAGLARDRRRERVSR